MSDSTATSEKSPARIAPGQSARPGSSSGRGRMNAPAPQNRVHSSEEGVGLGGANPPPASPGGFVQPGPTRVRMPGSSRGGAGTSPSPNQRTHKQAMGPPPGQESPGGVDGYTSSSPLQPHKQQHPQHQQHPGGRTSQHRRQMSEDAEAEEATRAALALAAVAQAANVGGRSPAEAAEIAKLQANNIAKRQQAKRSTGGTGPGAVGPSSGGSPPNPASQQQHQQPQQPRPEPRKVQTVSLESVKGLLRSELAGTSGQTSPILERLSDGENDAFLQQLLLFEYLRADTDEGSDGEGSSSVEDTKTENMKNSYACDRVGLLLSKIEMAYDSMVAMLPSVDEEEGKSSNDGEDMDDMDLPKIVPDLLPPCISRPGDATLEFFHACSNGVVEEEEHVDKDAISTSVDGTTASTELDSNLSDLQKERVEYDKGTHHSMFANMFSMKRPSFKKNTFASVFGKKRKGMAKHAEEEEGVEEEVTPGNGEYKVLIEREMLGLTVENVLERTVVRTVLPGGPAKKAGARVGSLIVRVGNIETKNLTHFETIDELRQSQRPLELFLRQISDDALRSAREEMGRLIRGSGFGKVVDADMHQVQQNPSDPTPVALRDRNIDFYTGIVRRRWLEAANMSPRQKKDEPILRVAEKLVWILTLFVVGLERESHRLLALVGEDGEVEKTNAHTQYHHTAKNYREAAKSVSRVLCDFVKRRMDPVEVAKAAALASLGGPGRGGAMGRGGRGGRGRGGAGRGGRGMVPGMPGAGAGEDTGEKLLLQIGDVLQRTRTFLADPTSPPAALLRGELISCLCDILDADTEMKLADDESSSSTQGGGAGGGGGAAPITDLGSAGSLLKLMVLNCPIMRSPGCESLSSQEHIDEEEIKRRFGTVKSLSSFDIHRLHAGNRFLAVVHRLAASRSTSARITACSLGPVLWSHLDFPHQLQVRLRNDAIFLVFVGGCRGYQSHEVFPFTF